MHHNYHLISYADRDTDLNSVVAQNVSMQLENQGITLAELARMCGIDRNLLAKIERGVADVKLSHLKRIADALCVEPAELLAERRQKRTRHYHCL